MRIDIELFEELFNLVKTQISKVYQVQVRMGASVWFYAIYFLVNWKVRNASHTGCLKNHANIVNKIHRTVTHTLIIEMA